MTPRPHQTTKTTVDDESHPAPATGNDNGDNSWSNSSTKPTASLATARRAVSNTTTKTTTSSSNNTTDDEEEEEEEEEEPDLEKGTILPAASVNNDADETSGNEQEEEERSVDDEDKSRDATSSRTVSFFRAASRKDSVDDPAAKVSAAAGHHHHLFGPLSSEVAPTFQLPCQAWGRYRWKTTILGCISSSVILIVRLLLDREPLAYLIHSVVVFLDMILIHFFTHSNWLSVSGELTTVVFFLSFHFTKETIFELLETTFIAVLCSFHLIQSRNKHKEREEQLEIDVTNLRRTSMMMIRQQKETRNLSALARTNSAQELEDLLLRHEEKLQTRTTSATVGSSWFVVPKASPECKRRALTCGERFFEYFLDGSAGVMYTSFLGLIISELITWASGDRSK